MVLRAARCVCDARERQQQTQMLCKNLSGDLSEHGLTCAFVLITCFVSVQNHLKCSTFEFPSESGILRVPFPTAVRMKRISGCREPQSPGYSPIGTATTHSTQYTPHPPGKHPAPGFSFHGNDRKQSFGKQWFFWVALVRDHSGRCCVISDNCQEYWLLSPYPADSKLSYSHARQNQKRQVGATGMEEALSFTGASTTQTLQTG